MSIALRPKEAIDTGKYIIKVYFKAVVRLKLRSRQPTKTVPLREIPGNKATACSKPIKIASLNVMSLSDF